ncbi:MAG: MurT ligase domain-containing protein [Sarcina sp.]|nr:MurT ligase domain-containing protein [Sarcina sp.]
MSGKDSLQIAIAAASCRFSRQILHRLNRGGTSLPGKLAMWFRRDILAITSEGVETILVTGTNGKTTTAAMLSHAMEEAGRAPLCNRSGANLLSGVTAEFAAAADLRGRPLQGRKNRGSQVGHRIASGGRPMLDRKDPNHPVAEADRGSGLYAVIECDEGALRQVAPLLKPRVIVVTNLFRDQLDRYGEVMHTLEAIREGIRLVPEAVLCLNADDSLVASLALDVPNPVIWFGMEETAVKTVVQEIQNTSTADKKVLRGKSGTAQEKQDAVKTVDNEETNGEINGKTDSPDRISDARYCIRCGAEYTFRYHTYAHLGDFRCPCCGYARPVPDVAVTSIDGIGTGGSRVHMRVPGRESVHREIVPQERVPEESDSQELAVQIALPAAYNIYNAAAALTAYTAAKLPMQEILKGLARMQSSFGRMETFTIRGVSIQMILVKNPAGCNQALDYLCTLKEPCTIVLCLNDLDADGHDISWIWDVDYEKLCGRGNIRRILVWGRRAEDLQLRLKYAGFQEKRIRRVPGKELKKLLDAIYKSEVPVFILPNYTTMLPLRDALRRAAGKDSFWKG